ncbi:Rpn family recombination-promoting nuclease/putative transposase [Enhygromyxa salina]|uniref:Transposase (putative) YhgA-like domain-containing protein n=1 Tax=Enhygromyxa salina TaxID=215803 RepID=A0A2S9YV22_9BACT|nr:Rpn family recombination-promoting nuclease/putative transposase [Enhygromyxa salina]PRQ08934.1 hypothetical protein ENSA7_13330 [Enhygromyxa salina]
MTTRPHDALFKSAFELPEHAAALFYAILPPELRDLIAWETLKREAGTFIGTQLGDRHSDLVFSATLGGKPVLLYLLLEHQSTNHPYMPLRMLTYLGLACERHIKKKKGGPLPLIIPVVISHAPGGWTAATTFGELFDPHPASVPGVARLIPSFSLLIEDLSTRTDEDLRDWAQSAFPRVALWLLRDGRDGEELLRSFDQWAAALTSVMQATNGMEAVAQCLRYIALVSGNVTFENFRAKIREQIPAAEEVAMTIAEELHQKGLETGLEKGREEGRREGRQEGRVGVLGKLSSLKFGGMPPEYAALIEAATDEQLERYIERILTADTIDAVFSD